MQRRCLIARACFLSLVGTLMLEGCQSIPKAVAPQEPAQAAPVGAETFVAVDAESRSAVRCAGSEDRLLPDGRLDVVASLANLSDHAVSLQVRCVFGDQEGVRVQDPGAGQVVAIAAGATQTVRFTSVAANARRYTLEVRRSP